MTGDDEDDVVGVPDIDNEAASVWDDEVDKFDDTIEAMGTGEVLVSGSSLIFNIGGMETFDSFEGNVFSGDTGSVLMIG